MCKLIRVEELSKTFKDIRAVDRLSFSVTEGEIYGFLGQNGAGKSTTMRMLLSLITPTTGSINIFGKNIRQHRKEVLQQIGAMIEKPDLYKYLTAYENLEIAGRWGGMRPTKKELMQLLEKTGIAERAKTKVKTFSQGMKQRLGLACALINNPKLMILDEPTNGLDPQGIADVRNLIIQLSRQEGKTILVSSHLLSEIEIVADSMLIIDKGAKVAEGKVSELLHPEDSLLELQTIDNTFTLMVLADSQWAATMKQKDKTILIKLPRQVIPLLVRFLVEKKVEILSVQPRHSLEEYFLTLTTSNQHVEPYKN